MNYPSSSTSQIKVPSFKPKFEREESYENIFYGHHYDNSRVDITSDSNDGSNSNDNDSDDESNFSMESSNIGTSGGMNIF